MKVAPASASASLLAPVSSANLPSVSDDDDGDAGKRSDKDIGRAAPNTVRDDRMEQQGAPVSPASRLPAAANAAEPTVGKDDWFGHVPTYVAQNGPLYGELGVAPRDIDQGDLGDCYFLASLGALSAQNPDAIRNALHPTATGYTVRLFAHNFLTGDYKPVDVPVDTALPEDGPGDGSGKEELVYCSSADGALWPMLFEKAYAELKSNSYKYIGEGGWDINALSCLQGQTAHLHVILGGLSANHAYGAIQEALRAGKTVTAQTLFSHDKLGVIGGHAYTVLKVYEREGKQFVQVRNPWGIRTETDKDEAKQGVFSLELSDFAKAFSSYSIGGTGPADPATDKV